MPRYSWQEANQLGEHIGQLRPTEAHDSLQRLLVVISEPRGRLDVRKMRCAQLLSFCLRGAHRGGASNDALLDDHLHMLERLTEQRSWAAVQAMMHDCVDAFLDSVQPEQHSDIERFVAWMRDDMRSRPSGPLSLHMYARQAGVTVEHLSRCYSSLAGQTFREERRYVRMETAKELLAGSAIKIRTVARRVGLKDTSQFIRDFRRYTGSTPGEYRRVNLTTGVHAVVTRPGE